MIVSKLVFSAILETPSIRNYHENNKHPNLASLPSGFSSENLVSSFKVSSHTVADLEVVAKLIKRY